MFFVKVKGVDITDKKKYCLVSGKYRKKDLCSDIRRPEPAPTLKIIISPFYNTIANTNKNSQYFYNYF